MRPHQHSLARPERAKAAAPTALRVTITTIPPPPPLSLPPADPDRSIGFSPLSFAAVANVRRLPEEDASEVEALYIGLERPVNSPSSFVACGARAFGARPGPLYQVELVPLEKDGDIVRELVGDDPKRSFPLIDMLDGMPCICGDDKRSGDTSGGGAILSPPPPDLKRLEAEEGLKRDSIGDDNPDPNP